jgi:hypothetical protein
MWNYDDCTMTNYWMIVDIGLLWMWILGCGYGDVVVVDVVG